MLDTEEEYTESVKSADDFYTYNSSDFDDKWDAEVFDFNSQVNDWDEEEQD